MEHTEWGKTATYKKAIAMLILKGLLVLFAAIFLFIIIKLCFDRINAPSDFNLFGYSTGRVFERITASTDEEIEQYNCHNEESIVIIDTEKYSAEFYAEGDKVTFITAYYGNARRVSIPKEIDGHRIVGLLDAFSGNKTLEEIYIPEGIIIIGPRTFAGCSNLKKVHLSSSVRVIGEQAFAGCGLSSIDISNSVGYIGDACFRECRNLSRIKLKTDNMVCVGAAAIEGTPMRVIEEIGPYKLSEHALFPDYDGFLMITDDDAGALIFDNPLIYKLSRSVISYAVDHHFTRIMGVTSVFLLDIFGIPLSLLWGALIFLIIEFARGRFTPRFILSYKKYRQHNGKDTQAPMSATISKPYKLRIRDTFKIILILCLTFSFLRTVYFMLLLNIIEKVAIREYVTTFLYFLTAYITWRIWCFLRQLNWHKWDSPLISGTRITKL